MNPSAEFELRRALRELRVEPPETGFEARLRERLEREGARTGGGAMARWRGRRTAVVLAAAAALAVTSAAALNGGWLVVEPDQVEAEQLSPRQAQTPERSAAGTPNSKAESAPSKPEVESNEKASESTPAEEPIQREPRQTESSRVTPRGAAVEVRRQRPREVPQLDIQDKASAASESSEVAADRVRLAPARPLELAPFPIEPPDSERVRIGTPEQRPPELTERAVPERPDPERLRDLARERRRQVEPEQRARERGGEARQRELPTPERRGQGVRDRRGR